MNALAEKFSATLATTERLSAIDLTRYQHRALERVVRHARSHVPFYRDRLAGLFDPYDRFNPIAWSEVPILTRALAQERVDTLRANSVPPEAGDRIDGQTSGSTGLSFRHQRNVLTDIASRAMTERLYKWHALDPDKRLARISIDWTRRAAFPDGLREGTWSNEGSGESWHLDIEKLAVSDQIDWLLRIQPAYLVTYPSAAVAILKQCMACGISFTPQAVLTIGEVLDGESRAFIEAESDGPVIDSYGAQEVGLIAIQCPKTHRYHICAESQLVEILDEHGQPVPAGKPGRVVVTSLFNFAMPFIRYEIGDFATCDDSLCPCGRTLPTIERIFGRQRHIFMFPGNRRIWPQASSAVMLRHVPNRQCQIAQTGPLAIEFRYVPQQPEQREDRAALAAYLAEQFDPRIEVSYRRLEEIPRRPGGKYEDYVCEIA